MKIVYDNFTIIEITKATLPKGDSQLPLLAALVVVLAIASFIVKRLNEHDERIRHKAK